MSAAGVARGCLAEPAHLFEATGDLASFRDIRSVVPRWELRLVLAKRTRRSA